MMKRILLLTFVVLMISASAVAQNIASLRGRVTDERGAAVVGADVNLRSRAGTHLLLITDGNGEYSFKYVPPGDYVLEVKARGFATFASKELALVRGQSLTEDVHLSIKTLS